MLENTGQKTNQKYR